MNIATTRNDRRFWEVQPLKDILIEHTFMGSRLCTCRVLWQMLGKEAARCPEGDKAAVFKHYKDSQVEEGKGQGLGKGVGI